jgi:hypothetical protein
VGDRRGELAVLVAEALAEFGPAGDLGLLLQPTRERPERVQDHDHVDRFLEERAGDRGQRAGGREQHRHQRHAHADHDALERDRSGPLGDPDRLREAVQPVHRDHEVSRL